MPGRTILTLEGWRIPFKGTVSGNTITFGPETLFNPNKDTAFASAAVLSPTQFVVAYIDVVVALDPTTIGFGTTRIGTVSGNSITFGPRTVFNMDTSQFVSAAVLSPTQFVVAYADGDTANFGTAAVGTISGDIVTFGTPLAFNAGHTSSASVTALSPAQYVVAYPDDYAAYVGTAIVGPSNIGPLVGAAKSSASGGDSLPVIIGGVSDVHSGLTPGAIYYAQADGTLTTSVTGNLVGPAISSTEILLKAGGK